MHGCFSDINALPSIHLYTLSCNNIVPQGIYSYIYNINIIFLTVPISVFGRYSMGLRTITSSFLPTLSANTYYFPSNYCHHLQRGLQASHSRTKAATSHFATCLPPRKDDAQAFMKQSHWVLSGEYEDKSLIPKDEEKNIQAANYLTPEAGKLSSPIRTIFF